MKRAYLHLMRQQFRSEFTSADQAIDRCESTADRVCLLDMGDNVGGGSSADGTELLAAIHRRQVGPSFGCLFDPEAVTLKPLSQIADDACNATTDPEGQYVYFTPSMKHADDLGFPIQRVSREGKLETVVKLIDTIEDAGGPIPEGVFSYVTDTTNGDIYIGANAWRDENNRQPILLVVHLP